MSIVASNDPRIIAVEVTDDLITAHLAVQHDRARRIHEAEGQGAGVQGDAPVNRVRFGVKAPCGRLCLRW